MDNYLSVLEDSLKKKLQILDELTDYTTQQQELLKVEELDYEAFDRLVDQKEPLIEKIMELDRDLRLSMTGLRNSFLAIRSSMLHRSEPCSPLSENSRIRV